MTLSINIEQMAKPVLNETGKISIISKLSNFLLEKTELFLNKFIINIIRDMDVFILSVEGSYSHIDKLLPSEAKNILDKTKKVISDLENLNEKLLKSNYFENEALKVKSKFMLKVIYKAESKLHKIVYKNERIKPTDNSLKEGVNRMNSIYVQNLLAE